MNLKITILALLFWATQTTQSQDFITEWTFPFASTQIRFNAETSGVVNYSWSASPSGNSGSGIFSQGTLGPVVLSGLTIQANDVVTLSMAPDNLNMFQINSGPDRLRLSNVAQWGSTVWTSMDKAYRGCANLVLSAIDVPNLSNVTDMNYMFTSGHSLNQDISNWDVSNVTNMSMMFFQATSFNQDIGNWDVSSVTNMTSMFLVASSFNQDISNWNVSNVTNMDSMFSYTNAFNQNLGNWNLNPNVSLNGILNNSGMDCDNYSATLVGWQANNPMLMNRNLGATGLSYGLSAVDARDALVNNQGWNITGDTASGASCGALLSVESVSLLNREMIIYPNPSTDAFTLKFESVQPKINISVYNIHGQIILNQTFENTEVMKIDLNAGSGVYFLKVKVGNQTHTHQLIKI